MGDPDRTVDERRNERPDIQDIDVSRLLSLLSALSQSARQAGTRTILHPSASDPARSPNAPSNPGHALVTRGSTEMPVRDLSRRALGPHFAGGLSEGSPRRPDFASQIENRIPSVGARRHRRWLVSTLACLLVVGGTAAAFSSGFTEHLLSRARGLASHDVSSALASIGLANRGVPATDHGQLAVRDQNGLFD